MTTTTTTMPPVDALDPGFEFLGVPRRAWGSLTTTAYQAEQAAANAEKAHAAAVDALNARREELAKAEAEANRAAEEARFSANRARNAKEAAEKATSPEEFQTCKAQAAEAETEANAAAERARNLRAHFETVKNSLPTFAGEEERKRGNATRFRATADGAKHRALETEIPRTRSLLARAAQAAVAEKDFAALVDSRNHLSHIHCRECRFWQPIDANMGECHARPPASGAGVVDTQPTTAAGNWCGWGEIVPPKEN